MATLGTGFEAGDRTFYTAWGWTLSAGTVTPSTTLAHQSALGHGGAYSLAIPVGTTALTPTVSTTSRWVGFWLGAASLATKIFSVTFVRSGTDTFTVQFDGSNFIIMRLGGTGATVVQTAPSMAPLALNHWIEIQLTAANAGGTVEVWIDGVQITTYAGDTQNAGSADWDQVRFGNTSGSITVYLDDLVITTAGEGRLTERFLPAQRPDANDVVALTPSAGTNWQCVDEVPTSTTDYNGTTVTGTEDTYDVSNVAWTIPTGGVHAVLIFGYANRQDGALTRVELICKPTVTNFYTTPVVLPAGTTYGTYLDIRNTNPDTATAWTPGEVDANQIGVRFTT